MSGTVARSLGALGDALGGTANVNFDAGTLFIDGTNNNVGIGTTSPGYALDILNSTAAVVRMAANTTSGYGFYQIGRSSTATNNWHMGSEGDGTFRFYNGNWGAGTERMRIDASGRVIRPSQPAFAAYGGSGITTTGSSQTCVFNTTATNVGGHYNTSNGRFTAPVAGLYHFTWFISQSGTATGPVAYILVNGNSPFVPAISYGTAYNNACASVVLSLNANDFVTVGVIAFNSSFSFIDFGYSGFSGFLI